MDYPLRIGAEVEATAQRFDGARLHFIAPQPFPPGQPLQLTLELREPGPLPLEARSVGSRKRPDGRFDVSVRLINLGRTARSTLEQAFPKAE